MTNMHFADVSEYKKAVRKLAEQEAKGQLTQPEFIIKTAIAAEEGHINPEDAREILEDYQHVLGDKVKEMSPATKSVRASELKQVIEAAQLNVDFAGTLQRAQKVHYDALREDGFDLKSKNTRGAFIDIARFQLKLAKDGDKRSLADADVRRAIATAPKEEKQHDEGTSLMHVMKALMRHITGTEDTENKQGIPGYRSEQAESAYGWLANRLREVMPDIDPSTLKPYKVEEPQAEPEYNVDGTEKKKRGRPAGSKNKSTVNNAPVQDLEQGLTGEQTLTLNDVLDQVEAGIDAHNGLDQSQDAA